MAGKTPHPGSLRPGGESGTILFTPREYLLRGPAQLSARCRYTTQEHAVFCTDDYAAYRGIIPFVQHRAISKLAHRMNHVERFNCTLRSRVSLSHRPSR